MLHGFLMLAARAPELAVTLACDLYPFVLQNFPDSRVDVLLLRAHCNRRVVDQYHGLTTNDLHAARGGCMRGVTVVHTGCIGVLIVDTIVDSKVGLKCALNW